MPLRNSSSVILLSFGTLSNSFIQSAISCFLGTFFLYSIPNFLISLSNSASSSASSLFWSNFWKNLHQSEVVRESMASSYTCNIWHKDRSSLSWNLWWNCVISHIAHRLKSCPFGACFFTCAGPLDLELHHPPKKLDPNFSYLHNKTSCAWHGSCTCALPNRFVFLGSMVQWAAVGNLEFSERQCDNKQHAQHVHHLYYKS